ncbi:hypothetical protein GCM10027570_28930 [Streptomonospora sediminis]
MSPKRIEMTDGFVFYSPSDDARFVYQEIFEHDIYSVDDLPEKPVVVDAGANVGLFSMYVKRLRPRARIIAFEPAPECLEALRRNVQLHGMTDVAVHPCGLGSETREASFTYYPHLPANSTFRPEGKGIVKDMVADQTGQEFATALFTPTELVVRVERLSQILAAHHPDVDTIDLLKIDVEGTEAEVLRGIDDADWAKVRKMELEVQDTEHSPVADVEELLRDRGFRVAKTIPPMMTEDMLVFNVSASR